MKIIKKSLISLLFILVATNAMSNDRYANYEAQGEWYSNSTNPAVKVFIRGSYVYAELRNRKQNLPATKLKRVNGVLLNEYTNQFIRIQDFNSDKFADIGVLKSVSYGGSNRCYSVFVYSPKFYTYKSKSSKTVCIE